MDCFSFFVKCSSSKYQSLKGHRNNVEIFVWNFAKLFWRTVLPRISMLMHSKCGTDMANLSVRHVSHITSRNHLWVPDSSWSKCMALPRGQVYRIKTNAHIIKLFPPSAIGITRFFERYCRYKFRGNPLSGALNKRGGKIFWFSTQIAVYIGNGTR